MKKIFAFIILCLLLTGCSAKSTINEMNSNSGATTSTTIEKQVPSSSTQDSQTNIDETQVSEEEKGWFTGVIGSSKIHAKLDFSGKSTENGWGKNQHIIVHHMPTSRLYLKTCCIMTLNPTMELMSAV